MKALFSIFTAVKATFSSGKMGLLFAVLWILLFVGMFSIPLLSIPGNDVRFQMELFKLRDYMLLLSLSFFGALTLSIQINIFVRKFGTMRQNMSGTTLSGAGLFSGIFSSIFASATCGMCLAALFSFLGFGTVIILVQYRWYIVLVSFLLLFASLYFASKRLNEGCEACMVKNS